MELKVVKAVLGALEATILASIHKKGLEEFTLPGLLKITAQNVPAKKKRLGKDPFTGQERMFAAKPATTKIKTRALKKLKDAALQHGAGAPRRSGQLGAFGLRAGGRAGALLHPRPKAPGNGTLWCTRHLAFPMGAWAACEPSKAAEDCLQPHGSGGRISAAAHRCRPTVAGASDRLTLILDAGRYGRRADGLQP